MKSIDQLQDGKSLAIGDYSYRKEGENVILVRYAGKKSRVVIPSGVTEIGTEAFAGSKTKEVVLPATVRLIGEKAFYCSKIEKILLPESVETVCGRAFDCSCLATITVQNPDTFFYPEAFDHAYDLTEVVFNGAEERWEEIYRGQTFSSSFTVLFTDGSTKEY